MAGYITAVRFYRNSADNGPHTGSLWSDSGQLLATGTFTNETAGWQQLNFSTPVAIAANTNYVASYHTSSGYNQTVNFFATQPYDDGTLHALQDGADGPNGVFYIGSGTNFPNQGYQASNYWVDVVFSQTLPAVSANIFPVGMTPPFYYSSSVSAELGVKFHSDIAGSITGVRFYRNSADNGPHTGSLWSDSGQLLATGTFTNETPTGWQQLNFSTPVAIAANTNYVASYHTSSGYNQTVNFFAGQAYDNGTLHAVEDGADGPNGVFYLGSGTNFPNQGYQASNYWIDVVFSP